MSAADRLSTTARVLAAQERLLRSERNASLQNARLQVEEIRLQLVKLIVPIEQLVLQPDDRQRQAEQDLINAVRAVTRLGERASQLLKQSVGGADAPGVEPGATPANAKASA
ncbi:hypothetical protein QYF68_26815 [Mycolicibacterium austroafricanum]|uniref:Histidine kinase n=1 Tax=Mycolicibacterium austroafricanum TaxID=39687 RepID=A0ABT8HKX8_MYCAO|nr:hypothetical protein [Mycolicibacterium austroafricanum]MDN4521407.1 hypothetical protein [Mycolicibacterium austroafricanum]